jgi:hypothetical protein
MINDVLMSVLGPAKAEPPKAEPSKRVLTPELFSAMFG